MQTMVIIGVVIVIALIILSIQFRLPKEGRRNSRKEVSNKVYELVSAGEIDEARKLLIDEGHGEDALSDDMIHIINKMNSKKVIK